MAYSIKSKNNVAFFFAVTAAILIISSALFPWWGIYYAEHSDDSVYYDYSQGGASLSLMNGWNTYGEFDDEYFGYRDSDFTAYGTVGLFTGNYNTGTLLNYVALSLFLSMLCIGFFIAFQLIDIDKKKRKWMGRIFIILALSFCLIAPIYFGLGFTSAIVADAEKEADFIGYDFELPEREEHPMHSLYGTYEEREGRDHYKEMWGLDLGWYFTVFAAICLLISTISSLFSGGFPKRKKREKGPRKIRVKRESEPEPVEFVEDEVIQFGNYPPLKPSK